MFESNLDQITQDVADMFKSKVVIVTGSSTGIGAGVAIKFASEGASGIVLHGRQEAALKSVKEKVEKAGQNVKVHICVGDITSDETRKNLINETIQHFGCLDVLVNNAGISMMTPICDAPIDLFDKLFDVNVRALVQVTQLAIPHLIKSSGNIVNVSSVAAMKAMPQFTYYCMAKISVDHYTRCLAVDLGPKGVRVNCVNPGAIPETEIAARQGHSAKETEEYMKKAGEAYPLRRPGTVEEVADTIAFLASDKGKFLTGLCVPIDGGSVILK